jgi:hypothetical protein
MANGAVGKGSLTLAVIAVAAGCSSPPQYSAPQSFTVGGAAVVQLVQEAIGRDRFAAPIEGTPIANCNGRQTCTISYTVRETTGTIFHKEVAADEQLFLPTAQVWKGLFNDPQFQSGTITVEGPLNPSESDSKTGVYFTITCDRAAASNINWDSMDGHELRHRCAYQPKTRGLPENWE